MRKKLLLDTQEDSGSSTNISIERIEYVVASTSKSYISVLLIPFSPPKEEVSTK